MAQLMHRIQAEEALMAINAQAAAYGSMEKTARGRFIRNLESAANPVATRQAARTPQEIALTAKLAGIPVTITQKKKT